VDAYPKTRSRIELSSDRKDRLPGLFDVANGYPKSRFQLQNQLQNQHRVIIIQRPTRIEFLALSTRFDAYLKTRSQHHNRITKLNCPAIERIDFLPFSTWLTHMISCHLYDNLEVVTLAQPKRLDISSLSYNRFITRDQAC
jgi:hypothetical protein